ncbi:MAG: trypsin-like peptidase domain-containing protein [Deltaproteobacteria bacterium]|nr:trypsin-like peptidase domain-containing protein [Deltaproteobacteria bacterium]
MAWRSLGSSLLIVHLLASACSKPDPGTSEWLIENLQTGASLRQRCAKCLTRRAELFADDWRKSLQNPDFAVYQLPSCNRECAEETPGWDWDELREIERRNPQKVKWWVGNAMRQGLTGQRVASGVVDRFLYRQLADQVMARAEKLSSAQISSLYRDSVCHLHTGSAEGTGFLVTRDHACFLYGGASCPADHASSALLLATAKHNVVGQEDTVQIECPSAKGVKTTTSGVAHNPFRDISVVAVVNTQGLKHRPVFDPNLDDTDFESSFLTLGPMVGCPLLMGVVEGIVRNEDCSPTARYWARISERPSFESSNTRFRAGAPVTVLGFPLGMKELQTTSGVISGFREDEMFRKRLIVTAPISPGSSGSPVFDEFGNLLGVLVGTFRGGQNLNIVEPFRLLYSSDNSPDEN